MSGKSIRLLVVDEVDGMGTRLYIQEGDPFMHKVSEENRISGDYVNE